jgi:beta-lactamase class A
LIPEALRYSIGQSDNITSNKIFDVEGGPTAVNNYVRDAGISNMIILTDYAHMGSDSQQRNRATPVALVQLLEKFYKTSLLSDSSKNLLWRLMVESTSGPDRLKGQLPAGTVVAHKTGTAGTDDSTGITEAFNDVGIVQLPNGKHFAIAVFVANSRQSSSENAAVVAHICKKSWDYFVAKRQK